MKLIEYDSKWEDKFKKEADAISIILKERFLEIEHIGSTAIKGISAKPIIDIAVLVARAEDPQTYVSSLANIGYVYYPADSSVERLFFRKGDPAEYHLSVTQEGPTTYWNRQLAFRDYLNAHQDLAVEYQKLKESLIEQDPTAGKVYSEGKSEFVKKILGLENNSSNLLS